MKQSVLTLVLVLVSFLAFSQKQGQKTNSNEKTIAKNQVIVKLEKQVDEQGNVKIVQHTTKIMIPESFPKYIDTGNPKEDDNTYHEAKMLWIREHPEEYEKIKHLNL